MVRRVVLFLAVMVVAFCAYHAAAQAAANASVPSIDWDNNGTSDATIWRPSESRLYVLQGPAFNTAFAVNGDPGASVPLPGLDYDGDGKVDFGLYRSTNVGPAAPLGTWTFRLGPTFTSETSAVWGTIGDVPVPADWDGNGVIDPAVYRPSEKRLYVLQAPAYNSAFSIAWGCSGCTAIPGDFDGDGRADFAVVNFGDRAVYVLQGGSNFTTAFKINIGAPGQTPVAGDFDGDGRLDIGMIIPGSAASGGNTWVIAQGGTNFTTMFSARWGIPTDTAVPGDYDGDGKLDIAVFRNGEGKVYVLAQGALTTAKYTTAFALPVWGGVAGDVPLGALNTRALP